MKTTLLLGLFVSFLFIFGCQTPTSSEQDTSQTESSQSIEIKNMVLKVDGMTCTGCEKTIETGLSQMEGISAVKASFTDSTVTIQMDENKVNIDQIKLKISDIGYTAMN